MDVDHLERLVDLSGHWIELEFDGGTDGRGDAEGGLLTLLDSR